MEAELMAFLKSVKKQLESLCEIVETHDQNIQQHHDVLLQLVEAHNERERASKAEVENLK